MKKNYIVLLLAILFTGITIAQEAQKNFINYQGIARNGDNALMASEAMQINIALKFGAANATIVYEESHTITTDANGVFSLLIGNGSVVNGDYNTLPWGSAATFVTVAMNGSEIGTTELMAVPYALSSGDADDQSAAEVAYDNNTSGLTATTTQAAIDELVTGGSVDADADPSNEFQTLSFDAISNELSLSDGNAVVIPSGGTDADADPTNEFQTLSFDAGTNALSLSDGNSVTIPSGGTDADADPLNEIQTLSFDATSNELSLTDGGTVTIPSGGTDADADPTNEFQTLSFDAGTNALSLSDGNVVTIPSGGTDADADPLNEIQTLSFDATSNELSLTDGGTVTIPSGGTDADADPTNEIQDISLLGTELTITDGSTIDLAPIIPPGGTDDQNLILTGDVLSIENGTGSVDLSTYAGDDADADPTNEIQDISLLGTELTITDGSTIDLAPIIPPGGTDDQNLILTGDVLSIENGTGSVDLSTYAGDDADADPTNEIDVTAKSGILTGDGTIVSGLVGTTDGQVAKWDDGTGQWVAGTDETGGAGSSLWVDKGNYIENSSGGVQIQATNINSAPLYISTASGASLILTSSTNENVMGFENVDGNKGYAGIATGINDMEFGTVVGNPTGKVHLTTGTSPKLTVAANGDVGIGTTTPVSKLDVEGDIRASGLVGSGQRNVMADADGNLVIGAGIGGGATSINDLSDGKADTNGSSLFLGLNAGANDDGTDNSNVGVGFQALSQNTTGDYNTANGSYALQHNTSGRSNTANGSSALISNTTGSYNTANGSLALALNTTGSENTANGYAALNKNSTGSNNTANGFQALNKNTTGNFNTANGFEALYLNSTGSSNTATGFQALQFNTTGDDNTANGFEALFRNSTGKENVANGYHALYWNSTGTGNTSNGYQALYANTTGSSNVANGYKALNSNTTGEFNTANGTLALNKNTTGEFNTANGFWALSSNTTGYNNTANGTGALILNTTGVFNTANGYQALSSNTSGDNNIGLGYKAQVPSATGDNQVRIGDTNISYAGIQVAWTVTSDKRWKDHIRNLPYGLNMVTQLRPVDYIRKNNEKQTRETGFIAQEVETTLATIGYDNQGFLTKDDNGYLSIRYNDLIPVLTKAIQEQQAQIEALTANQEKVVAEILKRINALETATPQNLKKENDLVLKEESNDK